MFLWSGAEEWGLKGSKNFCESFYEEIAQKYDLNNSYNINLDMIGSYLGLVEKTGILKKKVNRDFNDILDTTAKNLNIPIVRYNTIFVVKSDHRAIGSHFSKTYKQFQVSCFHSIKDSKIIHTIKDSPDKCTKEILNGCLNICYTTLKKIDSNLD
jgi:Zn-dependent M28 family amino/carboxypeptidase